MAISNLRSLARQAEDQGFAYMAVECAIYMAEAKVRTHDNSHARRNWNTPCCAPTSWVSSRLALGLITCSRQRCVLPATRLKLNGTIAMLFSCSMPCARNRAPTKFCNAPISRVSTTSPATGHKPPKADRLISQPSPYDRTDNDRTDNLLPIDEALNQGFECSFAKIPS